MQQLLTLLLVAGAAFVSGGGQCASCNLTLKNEMRTTEVLTGIKTRLGFDPSVSRKIPAEVLAKAEAVSRRASLLAEKDDSELQEAVTIFGTDVDEDDSNTVRFHFHNDTKGRSITRADVHLYIAKPESNPLERQEVTINVYESVEGMKGELLASHRVLSPSHGHAHHRVRLNADAVERLTRRLSAILIIEALVADGENIAVLPGDDDATDHPLSLSLVTAEAARPRRAINRCKLNQSVQACCVFDTVVDFEELGWEFIIAPKKINAMGCAGYCPNREKTDKIGEPNLSAVYESMGLPPTCCHPTRYEDMQMIYISPADNVVITTVKNMYVTQCACS